MTMINRSHLLLSIFGASIMLVPVTTQAQSAICKGMEETACTAKRLGDVQVCTWIKERMVVKNEGISTIKGYCRVSLKSVTPEQADKIKAELASKTTN
jgi:hypothetical protein